jgi:hypothetical protein
MIPLLEPSFISEDPELMNFLTAPEHRAFLEGLWEKFRRNLKSAEETEFRDLEAQPHPRIWEMYLAVALSEQGFTLSQKLREGPDIKLSDPTVWVEAVVSTDGEKGGPTIQAASRMPEILCSAPAWGGPPEDKMIERLVTSIKEKRNKLTGYDDRKGKHHRGYREKGIIRDTDPYVIALNTYKTSFAQFDHQHTAGHIPLIAKALFGYGETVFLTLFPRDGRSRPVSSDRWDHIYRSQRQVRADKIVPTNIFFQDEYSGISAVIVSKEGFWSWGHRIPVPLSENFIVVHNPLARNTLPNGWLKSGHEIWIEQGQLHKRSWTDGTEQLTESFPLPTLVSELEDGRRNYQRVSNLNAFL